MIANSHNLIITVKPANQRNNVVRSGGGGGRGGVASGSSGRSSDSGASYGGQSGPAAAASEPLHIIQNFPVGEELDSDEDDEDLVIEAGGEAEPISRSLSTYSMPSLPHYEAHLELRTAGSPGPSISSNGNLLLSSTTVRPTSTPDKALDRPSLEEEGTVITL